MGKKKGSGKQPQGRAKQKQKAQKGGTPQSLPRRFAQNMLDDDDWGDDDGAIKFKGFTGGQSSESSRLAPRDPSAKLRNQAISFVSSGNIAPTVQDQQQEEQRANSAAEQDSDGGSASEESDDDIDDSAIQTNIVMEADIESTGDGVANMNIDSSEVMDIDVEMRSRTSAETRVIVDQEGEPAASETFFIVDTVGDESLAIKSRTKGKLPARAPSPARSDSSEEIVTFRGRNKPTVIDDPFSAPTAQQKPAVQRPRPSPHPTDDLLRALNAPSGSFKSSPAPSTTKNTSTATRAKPGWAGTTSKYDLSVRPAEEWEPAPAVPYWKKHKYAHKEQSGAGPSTVEHWEYESQPARDSKVKFVAPQSNSKLDGNSAEDTITSLQQSMRPQKQKAALRSEEEGFRKSLSKTGRRGKKSRKVDNRALRNAHFSDSDDDSGGEAAYDDYMQNLIAQMDDQAGDASEEAFLANLKATAVLSQPSMMVDGKPIGDDEVLPKHMRQQESDDEDDASEGWETESSNSDGEDLSSSDLEEDLEYNEREMWEDEEDLRQRRYDKMTDEQIARLLAKQQELGIDGDELMIDDGMYVSTSDDGFGEVAAARAGLSDVTNSKSRRGKNKHGMRTRGHDKKYNFPDASLLADTVEQYGESGFDIMDFERPSLRQTKKGRKGKLPPELEALSDEELRDQMHETWEKDRSKKRQKKLEREELRREGLLGSASRKGRADLDAKYPLGMNMHNVHEELRDFLQRDDLLERAFPPMDKTDRKALHEICTALNLGSRSQGAGKKRFPIIYKTSRTGDYSNEMFVKIVQASSRGFLSNRGQAKKFANKTSKGTPRGGRGGGFSKAAVGLQNGDIVGAGAAEISHTSFGARMLAKHGWSKGMGLGKDGEGRTLPVEQVMRMGTAGLG